MALANSHSRILALVAASCVLLVGVAPARAILLGNGQPDPNFPGMKVWYHAGSIGVGEGNPVPSWTSSDANNVNTATQATSARQPKWTANGLNGLPTVIFDGNDDQLYMGTNIFQNASHPNTYFLVFRSTDTSAHILGLGSSSPGFLTTFGSGLIVNATLAVKATTNFNATGFVLNATSSDYSQGVFATATAGGGNNTIRIMGVQENSSATAPDTFPYNFATIGASDGGNSNVSRDPFLGQISEILVYGALTSGEIDDVESYLFNKYFVEPVPVPEPSTLLLAAVGLCGFGLRRRLLMALSNSHSRILALVAASCVVLVGVAPAQAILLGNGQPDPNFPGMKVWYHAGSIGVGEGNLVPSWTSSDANNVNTATQGNAARQPTWTANGLNGLPTVNFDGNNDALYMGTNIFQNASHPNTYFVVFRSTDTSAHILGLGSSSAGFLTTYGSGLVINTTLTVKANSAGVGVFLNATSSDYSQGVFATGTAGGGNNTIRIMGTQENTSATAPNAWPYNFATIGASDGDNNAAAPRDPFLGQISEILVYGSLTSGEIDDVESYLFNKYFVEPVPVPEPSTLLLAAVGLCGFGLRRHQR